jgi:hypothetical protein
VVEYPKKSGSVPDDRALFAQSELSTLKLACADLSWLLGRGYSEHAANTLVGDRYQLRERQRLGILRAACADRIREERSKTRRPLKQLVGQSLAIDGLNCILTVESALTGGVLLRGRDGALRDLVSTRGPRRMIEETFRAISLLANLLAGSQLESVVWFLDEPISYSGRIRGELEGLAAAAMWPWKVELTRDPDKHLKAWNGPIATSDSVILDTANQWVDLPSIVVDRFLPGAWILDFDESRV